MNFIYHIGNSFVNEFYQMKILSTFSYSICVNVKMICKLV